MVAEWPSFVGGRGQQPVVTMTEDHAKALVKSVVEAVVEKMTEASKTDQIEQYKQSARVEAERDLLRRDLQAKDAEIATLRNHIVTLNGFLSTVVPGSGAPVFAPPVPHSNNSTGVVPKLTSPELPLYPEAPAYSVIRPGPAADKNSR